jgi:hypothetical protein
MLSPAKDQPSSSTNIDDPDTQQKGASHFDAIICTQLPD